MRLVSDRSAQQIREDRQEGVELRSRAHRLVQNGTDVRCQLAVQRSTVLLLFQNLTSALNELGHPRSADLLVASLEEWTQQWPSCLRIGSWTLLTKELLRQRQSAEDFDQIVQLGADAAVFFDDIAVFFDDVAVDTGRRRLLDVGV